MITEYSFRMNIHTIDKVTVVKITPRKFSTEIKTLFNKLTLFSLKKYLLVIKMGATTNIFNSSML